MGSILDFITIKSNTNELHQKVTLTHEDVTLTHEDVTLTHEEAIKVFTDGACSNNGGENAKAGIGIYFGKDDSRNVSERITGKQTNNTAELKAIIKVYEILKNEIDKKRIINIYSDSIYAIRACGEYGLKMYKKNWKKFNKKTKESKYIPNHELVKEAFGLFHNKHHIKLIHVKAHTENTDELSLGNAEADRLANEAIGYHNCPFANKKPNISVQINKNYLNVPFSQKDVGKSLGARWDNKKKKWYYTDSINEENKVKLNNLFKN